MTRRSSNGQVAVRGVLIALAVAGVIGAAVFAAVIFISGRIDDALLAVVYIALGYLLLNVVVLVLGLLFKPSDSWALGAALATPVILAAIGFGYAAFRSVPV